jgi:hypothetical protein
MTKTQRFWIFLMSRPEMNFVSVSSIATIIVMAFQIFFSQDNLLNGFEFFVYHQYLAGR